MKLHWIGNLFVVLAGALLLASHPLQSQSQGRDADASSNVWGGRDISMEITPQGATLEFDCARGNMLEPIKPDAKGEFVVHGTYTPEHGGPITLANPPRDLPATYKGAIDGDTMRLQVIIADKNQQPEPFTLTRGKTGRVVKCR